MSFRVRKAVVVITAIIVLASCERPQPTGPRADTVIVHVYGDRESGFANELDRKFYNFTSERHTTGSGKWIWVATVEPYHYADELGGKVATVKPQMIILDRASDAGLIRGMDVNLQQASNACGPARSCPTFIPSWVSGEELEATRQVLAAVATDPH